MNCRDLDLLTDSRPFGSLTATQKREGEMHANTCHHCAPLWVAYARLAAVRVPPMPAELRARCRTLTAAHTQGSVLRFARRGVLPAVGGFVVLAAAAGVITAHFVSTPEPGRVDSADTPQAVTEVVPALPVSAQDTPDIHHVEQGEPDMNKSKSIAAAVALGAAAVAQAEAAAPATESRMKTAEEIIATNDLNRDGIVTLEEAAKVNGNLYVMFSAVYDTNHDDRIDVTELKRAMNEVEVGTAMDKITGQSGGNMAAARPETILANNDLDKDGLITKEEAKTAGKALFRMWDSYDLNKDGKVEYAELARAQGY